jgi:hypothetical protein
MASRASWRNDRKCPGEISAWRVQGLVNFDMLEKGVVFSGLGQQRALADRHGCGLVTPVQQIANADFLFEHRTGKKCRPPIAGIRPRGCFAQKGYDTYFPLLFKP